MPLPIINAPYLPNLPLINGSLGIFSHLPITRGSPREIRPLLQESWTRLITDRQLHLLLGKDPPGVGVSMSPPVMAALMRETGTVMYDDDTDYCDQCFGCDVHVRDRCSWMCKRPMAHSGNHVAGSLNYNILFAIWTT